MVDKPKLKRTTPAALTSYFVMFIVLSAAAGAGIDLGLAVVWLPCAILAVLMGAMFFVCMFNLVMSDDCP